MVTVTGLMEEALQELGIDYPDDVVTATVKRKMAAAEKTLDGSVGADLAEYLPDDPRAKELVLTYLSDLYDNRGTESAKVSNATRRMVHSIELQLRLELRRAKEAAGV